VLSSQASERRPGAAQPVSPYKILQIDPSAEPEVVEGAYRRLVAKYHPDRNPSGSAAERVRELTAAYELLSDPERRARYDREAASFRPSASERSERDSGDDERSPAPARSGPPRKRARVVVGVALAVAVAYFVHARKEAERTSEQLAALDLPTLFGVELDAFTSACLAKASSTSAELAAPYCACLADVIRARFDLSPVNADTAADYKRVVSIRFNAAMPGEDSQADCRGRVQRSAPTTTRGNPLTPHGKVL
jgi:hypothetical protein